MDSSLELQSSAFTPEAFTPEFLYLVPAIFDVTSSPQPKEEYANKTLPNPFSNSAPAFPRSNSHHVPTIFDGTRSPQPKEEYANKTLPNPSAPAFRRSNRVDSSLELQSSAFTPEAFTPEFLAKYFDDMINHRYSAPSISNIIYHVFDGSTSPQPPKEEYANKTLPNTFGNSPPAFPRTNSYLEAEEDSALHTHTHTHTRERDNMLVCQTVRRSGVERESYGRIPRITLF